VTTSTRDRSSWSIVTVRHVGAPWDRTKGVEPQFLAITPAGKVVVDWVSVYMVVIRIGDAAEYVGPAWEISGRV
jgi:hypothetical protein